MKYKALFIVLIILLSTGCKTLQDETYDTLITNAIESSVNLKNIYRAGYVYYLPKGMKFIAHEGTNEIFATNEEMYYMYVDRVSYYNKMKEDYKINEEAVYSQAIFKDSKFGYIEIKNTENDKYFIEIMYNYAKIEVIVIKDRANEAVAYAMSVLSSVSYQDTVLANLMGEDVLKSNEVEHNIFESAETESGYLEIVEEYGQYEEEENIDPDFIRR